MPKRDNQYRISVEIKVRPMKPAGPEEKEELQKLQMTLMNLARFLEEHLQEKLDEIDDFGIPSRILPWKVERTKR